ncbi:MAG: hypothetical protein ACFUZC_14405 [Chthoniobacteraceae bacterium]
MKSLPYCHIYAQLDQTNDRLSGELDYLFKLGLVCDTSVGLPQAREHRASLDVLQQRGGLIAPNLYPADMNPACSDPNWWKYSEEECFALLQSAAIRFAELQLGPMTAVNTYTPGNAFVAACRRVGVGYLLGFCAPITIEDGGWQIAHYGSPLSPYFVSDEDYRKPENPGERPDPLLMASMELRNPMVCLNHWSEGPWCPLNAQAADRWLEPSADPLPFLQIAEDWLRESELTGKPLFFHINLQYFFAGRCYEHNRRALQWLAEQRDKGRLAVGGLRGWARQMAANGGFRRQTTYWRGEMMGYHVGHRPGCFPDVVVDENLERQVIWQYPDPLPRRFYDYQTPWNYPAFEPKGTAPASMDFQGIEVRIGVADSPGRTVEIRNNGTPRRLSLAVWDALEGLEAGGESSWTVDVTGEGWTSRAVPHPSGIGGAVLLEGWVQPGVNRVGLRVRGTRRTAVAFCKTWGNLVVAQTFFNQGRPYTILAAQTPEPFVLTAAIRRGPNDLEPVIVESLIGLDHGCGTLIGERCVLRFDGTRLVSWQRLWGLRADQIELIGVEEIEARLKRETREAADRISPGLEIAKPGYQLFGNIRARGRWDRALAHTAGECEMRRMNDWLRQQRSGLGDVVIEAHPGIHLPRGSITKVLGHEFDAQTCAEGYGFQELCVDYPQGWDWGVAAWVQWRHLKLRLDGLAPNRGKYTLHLHAFDPERRDIALQVYFFDPSGSSPQGAGWCGTRDWVLPGGIEGRWDPSALCSMEIPEKCLAWPSIGIHIVPAEKLKLYDWIAERGAPGLLSHLWVSRV